MKVRVPDAAWIPDEHEGLVICDATSAVFAMGWPGIVECTLKATLGEGSAQRAIFASFGLEPDLAVDRADLLQAGLDDLKLGASVEEIYGHDWIRDPFSKGTWVALRPGQAADHARIESRWGAVHLAGADVLGVWSGWVDGAIESSVTIRSAWIADGEVRYWCGGAVVWDSQAEAELAEAGAKAAPFLRAIGAKA